ncbi:MAG: class II fructose-bisphosphate aldolase [Nitriliruptoraceae bacterium]
MVGTVDTARLNDAFQNGYALGGFQAYDTVTTNGIIRAAEQVGAPVIVQAGSSAFGGCGRDTLIGLVLAAARSAQVPVGVHLDHCRDLDEVAYCLDHGYTSVMFDGSHLSFADNVAHTAKAVELAHRYGAWCEGELGAIVGGEDVSEDVVAGSYTDPSEARAFIDATGVDVLAVAVGNVHGMSNTPATLDLTQLAAIQQACRHPLVLHGASGVDDATLRAAIGLGVVKINVNTEVRRGILSAVTATHQTFVAGDNYAGLLDALTTAASDVVGEKLDVFGCVNR